VLRNKEIELSRINFFKAFGAVEVKEESKCACGAICLSGAVKVQFGGLNFVVGCKCGRDVRVKEVLDISAEDVATYLNLESDRLLNQAVELSVATKKGEQQ
jgi:hypothetical protein